MEKSESPDPKVERLVADDTQQTVWLRLRRMTSSRLCRQIISARSNSLAPAILASKAEGLAWAVRSALGYWESSPAELNAKILTRYYAVLQISIAEQVASPDPRLDLEDAQKHTEQGHGLSTLRQLDATFPDNYHIAGLKSGHFYSYCKHLGIDLQGVAFEKRPREWAKLESQERHRLISLTDLFRRVPELQAVIEDYLGVQPLSLHVGFANRNMVVRSQNMRIQQVTGVKSSDPMETTFIAIYPNGSNLSESYLRGLDLPVRDIHSETDSATGTSYFVGSLAHPAGDHWWRHLKTYKSGYCGTSYIVPFWGGVSDAFLLHFIILYAMSILVRYLPSLWHEIEDGTLDHIRALIEHYLVIVDSVVPHMAVERITGVRLQVVQPGTFNAPV
jgi:hypothetical protein